jgi:phage-related tail protein
MWDVQAKQLEQFNAKLLERATSAETKHQAMMEQFTQISESLRLQAAENERLQAELSKLRESMEVGLPLSLLPAIPPPLHPSTF